MKTITELDSNFIPAPPDYPDAVFLDALSEPFRLYGLIPSKDGEGFFRMSPDIAEKVSEGVCELNCQTSGGRLRFMTDSPYICLSVKVKHAGIMPHFAPCGSYGFDMYEKENGTYFFRGAFLPPIAPAESYSASRTLPSGQKMRDITLDFPLYSALYSVSIGLKKGSCFEKAPEYTVKKPVVYYGSSITQGACATRPGSMYPAILSRKLDCDYIDLGFSGNARAEQVMADYIADLPMSAFVYDYDHNAPSPEFLEKTHMRLFETFRKKQPDTPVVILSRPRYVQDEDTCARLAVIRKTYEKALADGDQNVYLLNGKELMALADDDGTVDDCHPTDLGFRSMANAIEPILRAILYKK